MLKSGVLNWSSQENGGHGGNCRKRKLGLSDLGFFPSRKGFTLIHY